MIDDSDAYRHLAQEFYRPANIDSLLAGFRSIDVLLATNELSLDQASQLRAAAFRSMKQAAASEPSQSRGLILDHLLPHCLSNSNNEIDEDSVARYRYRECLRDWLEGLTEPSRSEIRNEVLISLIAALEGAYPERSCWVIAVIGYRGPDIPEALWRLSESNIGETGDIALATLSDLGPQPDERNKIISAIGDRARLRCNLSLVKAIWRLADVDCLDMIERYWLKPEDETFWPQLSHIIIRAIAEILVVNPDKSEIHDRIWSMFIGLYNRDRTQLGSAFSLNNELAPFCDNPLVIPFFLNLIYGKSTTDKQSSNLRYVIHHRIDACKKPRQLLGWRNPLDPEVREAIWKDASLNTGAPSLYVSPPMKLKEYACQALLCLGDSRLTTADTFEQFVGQESSPYVRQTISELLACLRIDPLPLTAVRWVKDRIDVQRNDSSDELTYRLAACQILRSASTYEALEALSAFGHTIQGEVLRRTSEALADVAVHLTLNGDLRPVDLIMNTVKKGGERYHRLAAGGAMVRLAVLGLLSSDYGPDLAKLLEDDRRDDYERSRIVATLGHLSSDVLTPDIESQLVKYSRSHTILAWSSLETLARHDRLVKHKDLIADRLGLHLSETGWGLKPDSKEVGASGYILSHLFAKHPDQFIGAVCTIIETKDWVVSAQLFHSLDDFFCGPEPHSVNQKIVDALVERIRLRQSRSSADLELFKFLGRWDRDSLTVRSWEEDWDNWMPDARVALADSLGESQEYKDDARNRAIDLILKLMGDGTYAVRRAAYRALSFVSDKSLRAYCIASPEDSSYELRNRGAEACCWLTNTEDFETAFQQFATDKEQCVRSAALCARQERQDRSMSEHYLEAVVECRKGTNEEILLAWKFGRALQAVGDDSCIERLTRHMQSERLPSNVRHWLKLIKDGLEKRWREVTQKWPEPWLTWKGTIEEGQGVIRAHGYEISANYTLWKQPAPTPTGLHKWGGAASFSDETALLSLGMGEAKLQLLNGQSGVIFITNQTMGHIRFSGQGEYPM